MIGSGTFRLEPPRLRTTEDPTSDRHATWYELFFDFVFAAAVIELATALADHPTNAVLGRFAGLFFAITWDTLSPLLLVLLLTAGVLGQLLLEPFTFPTGAASVLEPPEPVLESGGG